MTRHDMTQQGRASQSIAESGAKQSTVETAQHSTARHNMKEPCLATIQWDVPNIACMAYPRRVEWEDSMTEHSRTESTTAL